MKCFITLSVLSAVMLIGVSGASAQTLQYTFDPSDATIGCGDTLTANIEIDAITGLLGYTLVLNYDSAVLTPVGVTEGALVTGCPSFFQWLNSGSNDGTVRVDLAMLGCTITGSGGLFTVQFLGLQTGATPFTSNLTTTGSMRDSVNVDIPFSDAAAPPTVTTNCNNAPVLGAIGNQNVDEETLLTFTATATDVDPPDVPTFSLTGGVAGMNLDANTGVFTWTPTEAQGPGTYPVTVTASDGTDTDFEAFDIIVAEVNVAPVLGTIGNQNVDEETLLTFTATATDVDTPPNGLTFSLTGGVAGMNLDANTGVFTWTPTEAQGPGTYPVTVTVTDDGTPNLTDFEAFDIIVAEVNVAPVLGAIGNQNVDEETLLTFTATATDVDTPPNGLTFSLTGGVAGMNLDANTGVFTWTPTEAQGPGTYPVTVTVTDDGTPNLTDFEAFDIIVAEVNVAPVLGAIGNQNVDEETLSTFTATATDVDTPPNGLTFSLTGGVAGMNLDANTGVFTWTPTEAQGPGTYPVTVTVTDDGTPNLTDFETFDIIVAEVNVAPVLGAIGNQNVDEETLLTFTATATDVDTPPNGLTFSLTGGVAGMNLDANTGVFTWTPTEAQGPGTYPVTVTVTDDGTPNLTDFEAFDIIVAEVNVAPVLGAIGNQNVDEETLLTFTATATDVDTPPNGLTFSLTGGVAGMNLDANTGVFTWTPTEAQGPGTYPVTVTVTDDGTPNLTDFEAFDIIVAEVNVAPVLGAIGNQNVDEETLSTFTATATDVDTPPNGLTFSLTGGVAGMNLDANTGVFTWTPTEAQGPGTYPVTVTVTDDGTPNLTDFETFDIVVSEVNNAPVLGSIGNQAVDEEATLAFTATATDGDVPANTLTFSLDAASLALGMTITAGGDFSWTPTEAQGPQTYAVTVTVTDDGTPNLNDFETFDIVVSEVNNAPLIGAIVNQAVDEETNLAFTATATDGDVPANTLTFSLDAASLALGMTITAGGDFSWTPTEAQGPQTYAVTITVTDDGSPSFTDFETFDIVVNEVNLPPTVTNPGNQSNDELDVVSLQIVATDVDGNDLVYSASGLPASLTINSGDGLISGTIDCGASSGSPYWVVVTVTDNGTPVDSSQVSFSWWVLPLPVPAAVTSLSGAQVKTGNDSDGTTEISVSWSGTVSAGDVVQVYRKGFGDYPEYDDLTGSVPAAPWNPGQALASGWELTGVSASGGIDEPSTRDFWYYIAFVVNPCSVSSPASNMTPGTLNYHLGDVAPVDTSLAVFGDNLVELLDISKLGAHYGTSDGMGLYVDSLDVGPTTDMSVNGRPETDDQIQFEDLILFSINFGQVTKPGLTPPAAASANLLTFRLPRNLPQVGETFVTEVELASDGSIQGLSIPLLWDAEVVEPVDVSSGSLMENQLGTALVLSPEPGTVDAVVFGSQIHGEGVLAAVTFRVKAIGDPALGVGDIAARTGANRPIELPVEVTMEASLGVIPTVTRLLPNAPNPFRATTHVFFDLSQDGNVSLQVFSVDGRLVRTLLRGEKPAGAYQLEWDGRDDSARTVASGLYLLRLLTPNMAASQRLIRLR